MDSLLIGGYCHSHAQTNLFFQAESQIDGRRSYELAHTLEFIGKPSCTHSIAPGTIGKNHKQLLIVAIGCQCVLDNVALEVLMHLWAPDVGMWCRACRVEV